MKILCVSDLHFGKSSWGDFGFKVLEKARKIAAEEPVDVLYFGGDMAEPGSENIHDHLIAGLELFSAIPVKHKLWVTGNNDFELLFGSVLDYAEEMHELLQGYGIHLLDRSPVVIDEVGFVGSMGWYDGSLWQMGDYPAPDLGEPSGSKGSSGDWPQTWDDTLVQEAAYWNKEFGHRAQKGEGSSDVFRLCQGQLANDIDMIGLSDSIKKIVVCTHFVPSGASVKYGHSAKYDYLNYYMGWDAAQAPFNPYNHPKVVQGLCGHTHRRITFKVTGTVVDNVSGSLNDQACIIEV